MTTITIPKNLIGRSNLIAIPYAEYEQLLISSFNKKEISLSVSQKNRLKNARKNLSMGKFLTFDELRKKMGVKN